MKGRLIAIAMALVVLAFAEIRPEAEAPASHRQSDAASVQLADPPAAEPEGPAVIATAVSTSATVQTVVAVESRRRLRPTLSVFSVSHHPPGIAHSPGKPRIFPLLI